MRFGGGDVHQGVSSDEALQGRVTSAGVSTEDVPPQQRALELVADAAINLEQARALLVARASVAIAADLDLKIVAKTAGLDRATLRRWLLARERETPS